MAVFATHVVLMRDFQAVTFAPGDLLPDWAEDKVGSHCLVPEAPGADQADETDVEDPETDPESDPDAEADESGTDDEDRKAPAAAPDFTAAPRRRGRTQK